MAQQLAPLNAERLTPAILAFYRTADAEALSSCADVDQGLAARLIEAARSSTTLPELFDKAATKRYTTARLRRAVLFGLCGVRPEHLRTPPAYIRLLAASRAGCEYLSAIRKVCPLPILTKPSDVPSSFEAQRQRAIEERLEALVTLAYPESRAASYLLKQHPTIEK